MNTQKKQRTSKKLKNNIVLSGIYQILIMIVPIITTPYVTRIFNVKQMGSYGLATAVVGFFVVFANFGLSIYGTREIAKQKTSQQQTITFFSLWMLQIIISIISFIIFYIVVFVILNVDDKTLFVIQSMLILINILDVSWFFIGLEELGKTISRNLVTKIFTTAFILLFIKNNDQLYLYAGINILGLLLGNLSMFVILKQYLSSGSMKIILNMRIIKESFVLLIPTLFTSFYKSNDRVTLQLITKNNTSVGIYDQGQKIINLIFSVFDAAINALTPRMSYYVGTKEYDKVLYYFQKSINVSSLFSIIVTSGTISVSNYFVEFFFGQGYDSVANVLNICSISFIFMPISIIISKGIMIPVGDDKKYSKAIFAIGLSNISLNIIFTPYLSYIGTSLAYTISEIVGLIVRMYYSRNHINLKFIIYQVVVNSSLVTITLLIVINIKKNMFIENSFIAFLIYGIISVLISIILFEFVVLFKKIKLAAINKM